MQGPPHLPRPCPAGLERVAVELAMSPGCAQRQLELASVGVLTESHLSSLGWRGGWPYPSLGAGLGLGSRELSPSRRDGRSPGVSLRVCVEPLVSGMAVAGSWVPSGRWGREVSSASSPGSRCSLAFPHRVRGSLRCLWLGAVFRGGGAATELAPHPLLHGGSGTDGQPPGCWALVF